MTRFLRVGFLGERARELRSESLRLKEILSRLELAKRDSVAEREVENVLLRIVRKAAEISDFLEALPSEPLVWTGDGDTDEVIAMLEGLIDREGNLV